MKNKTKTLMLCFAVIPFLFAGAKTSILVDHKDTPIIDFSKVIELCKPGADTMNNETGQNVSLPDSNPVTTQAAIVTEKSVIEDEKVEQIIISIRAEAIIFNGKTVELKELKPLIRKAWEKENNTEFILKDDYAEYECFRKTQDILSNIEKEIEKSKTVEFNWSITEQ